MAKREVNCGKVPGADNRGDLFTKALDGITINKHVQGLNCEFAAGRDDLAYTIHFIGAAPDTSVFNKQMGEILELDGSYRGWARTDMNAKTTKTSMRGGPEWSQVKARVTMDAMTHKLIKVEQARHITRNCEHALLFGGERDITTILIFDDHILKQNAKIEKAEGKSGRCHG